MTYDDDSWIQSRGVVRDPLVIDAWIAERGRAMAAEFAPDGQYLAPPLGIGAAVLKYADLWGINGDIAAAQIVKETAGWQSAIARDKRNPAGLGAVNDNAYEGAIEFEFVADGVRAQMAHLANYAIGSGEWSQYDPRTDAMRPLGYLSMAPRLRDLDGKWAVPGVGYGASVARLANELVEYAGVTTEVPGEVYMADDPQAVWLPSSNYTAGRQGMAIGRIIIHTTEGSYTGSLNWLRGANGNTSNRESSSHYLLDEDGNQLAQLVREDDTAHTAGNWPYNLRSVNVEMEGFAGRGGFSDALYDAVGALVGRIAERHTIPLDREHVIGHADVPPPNNHTDPGPFFNFGRLLAIARGEPIDQPGPAVCREFPETGHRVCHGFRAFWESYGKLPIFGYPLTEEFQENGHTVQYFERARFEHHPGSGEPFDVILGRLGAEAMGQGGG